MRANGDGSGLARPPAHVESSAAEPTQVGPRPFRDPLLPVLPSLRPARRHLGETPAMLVEPDGREACGYRQLRARLRRRGDPAIIALRGDHPRTGTALVAVNLALAFAEGRREVLLIESGLRAPSLRWPDELLLSRRPPTPARSDEAIALRRAGFCLRPFHPRLRIAVHLHEASSTIELLSLLPSLRAHFHPVIVDAGSGDDAWPADAPLDVSLEIRRDPRAAIRFSFSEAIAR